MAVGADDASISIAPVHKPGVSFVAYAMCLGAIPRKANRHRDRKTRWSYLHSIETSVCEDCL